ncbi:MAG: Holliday junction branch migration protein RuvA, partial [Leucobacter sp.]
EEIDVFGHLISVSGVGPRSALGVLAALTPLEIARAVTDQDEMPFRKVSGIGPKTAKLLLVSLAGKLPEIGALETPDGPADSASSADAAADAVREGLVGLGWKEAAASVAVEDALAAGAPSESAALLRAALALLQAGRGGGSR